MTSNYVRPQQLICVVLLSVWVVHFFNTIYYLEDVSGWIWNQNLTYPDGMITPWLPIERDGIEVYVLFTSAFLLIALTYGLSIASRFSVRQILIMLLFLCVCEQAASFVLWYSGTKAKAESLVINIKQNPVLQQAAIIFVESDQFALEEQYIVSLAKYIHPDIFSMISGDNLQIVVPNLDQGDRNMLLNQAVFPKINLLGCQASIVVFKGDRQHDLFGLVVRYWGILIFKPHALEAYLKPLTYLRVTPIHTDTAQSCSAW